MQRFELFELGQNWHLTWFKLERRPKHQQILSLAIVKWLLAPRLAIKKAKTSRRRFLGELCANNIGKIHQQKEKAVTTRETLTKDAMKNYPISASSNCQL